MSPVNINPETTLRHLDGSFDETSLRRQLRSIAAHLDDGLYVWRLEPAAFCADPNFPGAVFGSTANSKWAAVQLADAATRGILFNRRVNRTWLTGHFLLEVDYTSNGAGTSNFGLDIVINASTKTGNLNTPTVLYSLAVAWPGPAAAFGQLQFSAYTSVPMPAGTHNISLVLRRNGTTDANNNRLDITGVSLTHIPAQQEVDVR